MRSLVVSKPSLLLTLFMFLALPSWLMAEGELEADFVLPEVYPWAWEDPDGEARGLLVSMLDELDEMIAPIVSYRLRPLPRAILELQQGEAMFSTLYQAPEVDEAGEQVFELVTVDIVVIGVHQHTPMDGPTSLDDLDDEPVGFIHGTYYGEAFRAHEGIRRVGVRDMNHGLELMKQGRLTAMVGSDLTLAEAFESGEIPEPGKIKVLFQLDSNTGWVYRSRAVEHPEVEQAVVEGLQTLREEGKLESIFSPRLHALE